MTMVNRELDLKNVKVYTKDNMLEAVDLIGQEVYLSDYVDFRYYYNCTLLAVQFTKPLTHPFIGRDDSGKMPYKYFILKKDAKFKGEKQKKLRPFKDITEFGTTIGFAIGNVITFKKKDWITEYTVIYNGYAISENDVLVVYLGTVCYTLEELKDSFVYYRYGEWHPFGIEE